MTVPAAAFHRVDAGTTTVFGACPSRILDKRAYVEEEWYVAGTASRYRITDPMADAQVVDGGWAYTTRMIVRRPADVSRFNGIAVVEWNNVSLGQDIDFVWAASHDYLMSRGYVTASLSVQRIGIEALKAWSEERYGCLSVSAPNVDDVSGTPLDETGDVLAWDVFSQTIAALRQGDGQQPLSGLIPEKIIATGESQSALRLASYYNSIDPDHRVIDGIIYYDAAGPLRNDSPTKAISIATEIGVGLLPSGLPADDGENHRRWEVAGASHASLWEMQYVDAISGRDGYLTSPDGARTTVTGQITGATWYPLWSTVPTSYVLNAAFERMAAWVSGGASPSPAALLERDFDAAPLFNPSAFGGKSPALAHDAKGKTLGGIRLAEYTYAVADVKGAGNTGPGACWLAGMHRWFTPEELSALYPDPAEYFDGVLALTLQNVSSGFLLPDNAMQTVKRALRMFSHRSLEAENIDPF